MSTAAITEKTAKSPATSQIIKMNNIENGKSTNAVIVAEDKKSRILSNSPSWRAIPPILDDLFSRGIPIAFANSFEDISTSTFLPATSIK